MCLLWKLVAIKKRHQNGITEQKKEYERKQKISWENVCLLSIVHITNFRWDTRETCVFIPQMWKMLTMVWMFVFIQNLHVENLMFNGWYQEMGHPCGDWVMKEVTWTVLVPLKKRLQRASLPLPLWGHTATCKRTLTWPCWHPDLPLPASGTVRNKCLIFTYHPVCSIFLQQSKRTKTMLQMQR